MKDKNIKWLIRSGLTPKQVGSLLSVVNDEVKDMEQGCLDKSFLLFVLTAADVLSSEGYWPKSPQKIKHFVNDILSLYDSIDKNAVDWKEVEENVEKIAGIKIHTEYVLDAEKTKEDMIDGRAL